MPRAVRKVGRTDGGWPEGEGPELHELLDDAAEILDAGPRPVNGEPLTAFALWASRAADKLRWALKLARKQPPAPVGAAIEEAATLAVAALSPFPYDRTRLFALVDELGRDEVAARFGALWASAGEQVPALRAAVAEIERTGWGLEPEGLYRIHIRVGGRAICVGDSRALAVAKVLYGRGWVERQEVAHAIWGQSTVNASTFRSALVRVNRVFSNRGAPWGRATSRGGRVRLELYSDL